MLHIPIHVIAFFMAVMMVPKDVNQFTIAVYGKEIQWTREETGWRAVHLPRDDGGMHSIQGSEVTITGEGHKLKTNISRFLTLPEDLDWKSAKEIQVALKSLGDPVQIQREDGKIVLSQAKGELFEKPVTITWKPVAKGKVNELADTPTTLNALPLAAGEALLEVKDGEAAVNDDLIKRFAIGGEKVTASYHNKSQLRMRPRYTIELYNSSGMLIGEDTTGNTPALFGGTGYIDPGAVGSGELRVTWHPVDRILAKSAVPLPADWRTVKWIVLKDNQPRTMVPK